MITMIMMGLNFKIKINLNKRILYLKIAMMFLKFKIAINPNKKRIYLMIAMMFLEFKITINLGLPILIKLNMNKRKIYSL